MLGTQQLTREPRLPSVQSPTLPLPAFPAPPSLLSQAQQDPCVMVAFPLEIILSSQKSSKNESTRTCVHPAPSAVQATFAPSAFYVPTLLCMHSAHAHTRALFFLNNLRTCCTLHGSLPLNSRCTLPRNRGIPYIVTVQSST